MSRLVGFLQDDLKEIDNSFESVKQIMEDKIYYENRGDLENHIERIDRFISYWQQHAKSLEEALKIENVEPVQSVKFVRFQKEHLHLNNVFQYAVDKNNPLMIFEVCRFINGQSKKYTVKRRFKFYEKYFCLYKYDYLIKDELKKINSWILFLQSEI